MGANPFTRLMEKFIHLCTLHGGASTRMSWQEQRSVRVMQPTKASTYVQVLYVCMYVWMCMDVWMYGCMDVGRGTDVSETCCWLTNLVCLHC